MPIIKIKLHELEIDIGKLSDSFHKKIQVQMRQAAREFARAAMAKVHVRTGFARGSLGNITSTLSMNPETGQVSSKSGRRSNPAGAFFEAARLFRAATFSVGGGFLGNKKPPKSSGRVKGGEYYKGVLKTPTSGRQFATPTGQIFTNKMWGEYLFNYTVDIIYYAINDFFSNKFTPSAPWGSFEAGRLAFKRYMETVGIKKLTPKVSEFWITTEVKVDEKGVTKKQLQIYR